MNRRCLARNEPCSTGDVARGMSTPVVVLGSFVAAGVVAAVLIACAPRADAPVNAPAPIRVPVVQVTGDSAGCPKDMALAAGV